ncbi:MAG: UDP-2,4-diacetamido-2,4,6-trideoxy-beta-L-altropyranose hydrolase [bacterium]|nr:UDP-2,4-diacetamido-2,4,6-trideoxy-beta-L-altropyranose hydrolase [bacterium]
MRFAIRVDSSMLIGSGHVMRCLTLSKALRSRGHHVTFICRELPGNLIYLIKENAFDCEILAFSKEETDLYLTQKIADNYSEWLGVTLTQDATETYIALSTISVDFLIVDHYSIDSSWEHFVKPLVKHVLVIDDLANRHHDCDILLDPNFYKEFSSRYQPWINSGCRALLGPSYALIRNEFNAVRLQRAQKNSQKFSVKRILVYMGGADPKNITKSVLCALHPESDKFDHIDIILGSINPWKESLQTEFSTQPFHIHVQPSHYVNLLAQADLAISAGGSACYERIFIGLPSIVIPIAENQMALSSDLHEIGAHLMCPNLDENLQFSRLIATIERQYEPMQKCMSALIDGNGIERVISEIERH